MKWVLLDSNARDPYFKRIEVNIFIKKELFELNQRGRINETMYFAPPFMVYEMLGYGKLSFPHFDNTELLEILEKTKHGSSEELEPMDNYFQYLFSKYREHIDSDKRFSIKFLRRKFDLQKSYVHPEAKQDFDSLFARRIGNSLRREYLKDFLAFEMLISHDFIGLDPDRMARFFLVTTLKFIQDFRGNSFYRAMVRIWRDSYKSTVIDSRDTKGYFKNFTDETISNLEKAIKLGKGEDLLDSEGIQFLLTGHKSNSGETEEVLMITGDPPIIFMQRVGFFKSLYQMIGLLFAPPGETTLPPLQEGLIGFLEPQELKMKWVETSDIPSVLHYLETNTYQDYLERLNHLLIE